MEKKPLGGAVSFFFGFYLSRLWGFITIVVDSVMSEPFIFELEVTEYGFCKKSTC